MGVRNSVSKDAGVGSDAADFPLGNHGCQLAVIKHLAGNIIVPDRLAKRMQSCGGNGHGFLLLACGILPKAILPYIK
jgi:hypothetical protein